MQSVPHLSPERARSRLISKTITISLPDATYDALKAAAARAYRPPEEVAAAARAERFGSASPSAAAPTTSPSDASDTLTPEQWHAFQERFLAVMRERGHLVDPSTLPPYPGIEDLPPYGSAEEAKLLAEPGDELSDAWEASGKSIADLVES